MIKSDDENLSLVESVGSVDAVNSQFYGRYPFPWRPMRFDYLDDPDFETVMLNQAIGDWGHKTVPADARIWVAGCGTNQAVFTALRFPKATVLGTDLSAQSLEICGGTATALGLSNLKLKRESINSAPYEDEFDYVICTGVIHHNADPKATLGKLAGAMKPTGVLELMVYNRYHRIITTTIQKAVRILTGSGAGFDPEAELAIARRMIDRFPVENLAFSFLQSYKDEPESAVADALIQPVEHSYTVESLEAMATDCGLELLSPCINASNRVLNPFAWNMDFDDPELQQYYDVLPDSRRWQVSNLLLLEASPMLWFYLQRADSGRRVRSEKEVCADFLAGRFTRAGATQRSHIMSDDGHYRMSPYSVAFPAVPFDSDVKKVVDAVDGRSSMREVLERSALSTSFNSANRLRLKLTTPAFPYLVAAPSRGEQNTGAGAPAEEAPPLPGNRTFEEQSRDRLKTIRRRAITESR